MVSVSVLLERLASQPHLFTRLQLADIQTFFTVSRRLLPLIELDKPRSQVDNPSPPDRIIQLLASHLAFPLDTVHQLWQALGDIVIAEALHDFSDAHLDGRMSRMAPWYHLGCEVIISSTRFCQTDGCRERDRPLQRKNDLPGYLHTKRRGVLPVRIVTLYCRSCLTTYRPNYFVSKADADDSQRVYYPGIPDYIEVNKHTYVEKELVAMFRMQMCFAHASGDTIARMYNLGITADPDVKALTGEAVWNAFYIHALLCHHLRWGDVLVVPNKGNQAQRFDDALDKRNMMISGSGQPHWAHACDQCEKLVPAADGDINGWKRISACVMDGVCIGHPRCNVQYCTERLLSPRDRFCPDHRDYTSLCAIKGCDNRHTPGFRTCPIPTHRDHELRKRAAGEALKRLRGRIQQHKVPQASGPVQAGTDLTIDDLTELLGAADELFTSNRDPLPPPPPRPGSSSTSSLSEPTSTPAPSVPSPPLSSLMQTTLPSLPTPTPAIASVIPPPASPTPTSTPATPSGATSSSAARPGPSVDSASASVPSPSATPKAKSKPSKRQRKSKHATPPTPGLKDCMSRRWTHNEQLMVRPCGVTIARATFYESEGVANVVLFILAVFPLYFPRALPNFLFFDNACSLLAHLLASGQTWADAIALVVDVFHAVTKHKDSDAFCQLNCSPAGFPELLDDEEKWEFNSSACEQTNVWFGDFGPIVREMSEIHHNFFLDEMIMVNNDYRVSVLAKAGARPRLVPLEELRLPRKA